MAATNFKTWQIGTVKITRIIELGDVSTEPEFMLPGVTTDDVKRIDWLVPHYATPGGQLTLAFQAFVVEDGDRRIVVDTCNGNDKHRPDSPIHMLTLPFLEDLTAAGYPPESIDTVLCTHLHVDHVGWNTRLVEGRWVPTFPNARYLYGRAEWDFWSHGEHQLQFGDYMADSVRPVVEAGLVDFVGPEHRVSASVWLEPTPGHTPGHVSVRIESGGRHAVVTGDMVHNPMQCARPELSTNFCHDMETARTTRQRAFKGWSDQGVMIVGSHFGGPTAGWLKPEGNGYRLESEPSKR